jgi:hypothetical protein
MARAGRAGDAMKKIRAAGALLPIADIATPARSDLTPIGDLPLAAELGRQFPPLTPVRRRLIDAAVAIRQAPYEAEKAYMARPLILCTLPQSDPERDRYGLPVNVPRWMRRSADGKNALVLLPGWDDERDCSYGYPYGVIPRLLLFWITTRVQYTKNRSDMTEEEKRTLDLGRNLSDFMRDVGLDPRRGGKRSDGARLRSQMDRLFNARISFRETATVENMQGRRKTDMDVAPESELWWNLRRPAQDSLYSSWIRLGQNFYRELAATSIPVNMLVLKALKNSPLALDLYAWVCYYAFVVMATGQASKFVAWKTLMRQLGTEHKDVKNFKKKAQAALGKIKSGLYPGLTIGKAKGGFRIHATRLAVPPSAKLLTAGE